METKTNTDCISAVRQGISLIDGNNMNDELFNEKADEFATYLVESFGCEIMSKIYCFAPLRGKYWQLKYVSQAEVH